MSNDLKIGDQYRLNNMAPMELVGITDDGDEYVFMDGMSPWGGKKEDIEALIESGELKKVRDEQ